jgi:hypothetical protein
MSNMHNIYIRATRYYYLSCEHQVAVKIRSPYLSNNSFYLSSNTIKVV